MAPHCHIHRTAGILACVFALACLSPSAFAGAENPKDAAAVNAVTLSVPLVKRVLAVNEERDALDDDTPLFLRTKDHHVHKTLDELIAEVHAHPAVEAVIRKHGFTTREFLLAALATYNGSMGNLFRKAGEPLPPEENLSEAQIRFFADHADELDLK